jgi:hypothetical protein
VWNVAFLLRAWFDSLLGFPSLKWSHNNIDERLAWAGSDVLEQHKENIARLVELNDPAGNPSPIEDEQQAELFEELSQVVV